MHFKKRNFQVGGLIYLFINILYLVPTIPLLEHNEVTIDNYLKVYIISLGYYFLFYLPYLHILFCIALIIYCIKQTGSFKNTCHIIVTIVVVAIDILINIYWASVGRSWVIQ